MIRSHSGRQKPSSFFTLRVDPQAQIKPRPLAIEVQRRVRLQATKNVCGTQKILTIHASILRALNYEIYESAQPVGKYYYQNPNDFLIAI